MSLYQANQMISKRIRQRELINWRPPTKNAQFPDSWVGADIVGGRTVVAGVLVSFHQRLEAHKPSISVNFHTARLDHTHAVLKTDQSPTFL